MEDSKYASKPNLLYVATELSRYKNPDRVLGALRLILESSVDDPANSQDDLSLLSG